MNRDQLIENIQRYGLKAEYMFLELSNDEYLKTCMKFAEYLGVE